MKKIPLTQGKFALVDDEDFERVNQFKWKAQKAKGNWYANRVEYPEKKVVLMHRFVLGLTINSVWCDHINHDGLDNRKLNLRACNRSQNTANKRPVAGKSSIYLGVCKYKNKWRAALKHSGKQVHLGDFESEKAAAIAYNLGAAVYHGEFANLNVL